VLTGRHRDGQAGFTLVEVVMVMAGVVALSALTLPRINGFLQIQRARTAARVVENQLQTARLRAVSASRAMRVRFNCPSAGKLRILEFTGVAATDNASNRCDPSAFPSPGPNDTLRATPSLDSPVVELPSGSAVTGSAPAYEFTPHGTVFAISGTGAASAVTSDVVLTVTRYGVSSTVRINGMGRIRLEN
jgi:prepilin-type N-terminal cleavage/methylation domain-containing protein